MLKTVTMKFGGTSVGSAEAIHNLIKLVRDTKETQAEQVVVVVSAMSGVTNMLQEGLLSAEQGDGETHRSISNQLMKKHWEAANELLTEGTVDTVMDEIADLLEEFVRFCDSVQVLGEATPRVRDYVMALGERMSVRLVSAALSAARIPSEWVESATIVVTDEHFQDASPYLDETREKTRARLLPLLEDGIVPVVTGFIGRTRSGITTTLGRGGSDYSAGLIGACIDSDEVWIWTDVDGVMSADPRIVPDAHSIEALTYREVSELAFYGAKVLHPKTLRPLGESGTPVRVKNTFNPDHPGTLIVPRIEGDQRPLKSVTAIRNVSMVTVEGRGMQGIPGVAGRTFMAVSRTGTSVLMISQSSSEQAIFFVIPDASAKQVKAGIEEEFSVEMARRDIDSVEIDEDFCIVTVVGTGMRNTPGVAARIFMALGDAGVNVQATAQGSSDCGISLAVSERQLEDALKVIHRDAING